MVYHRVNFRITETHTLAHAHNHNTSVELRISKALVTNTGVQVIQTKQEIDKLEDGNYHNNVISSNRIKKIDGFLLFISP